MKVLEKATLPGNNQIQIEDWSDNYNFVSYGSTLACYISSKSTIDRIYGPKAGERYRFSFDFGSHEEAKQAYQDLIEEKKTLCDFRDYLSNPEYGDCI